MYSMDPYGYKFLFTLSNVLHGNIIKSRLLILFSKLYLFLFLQFCRDSKSRNRVDACHLSLTMTRFEPATIRVSISVVSPPLWVDLTNKSTVCFWLPALRLGLFKLPEPCGCQSEVRQEVQTFLRPALSVRVPTLTHNSELPSKIILKGSHPLKNEPRRSSLDWCCKWTFDLWRSVSYGATKKILSYFLRIQKLLSSKIIHSWVAFYKMGHSRPHFLYFCLF